MYDVSLVAALTGMSARFVRQILDKRSGSISLNEVLLLLDQDAFAETFVQRSRIPEYLLGINQRHQDDLLDLSSGNEFFLGNAVELIGKLPKASVQCVVTSTPYWAMRIYEEYDDVKWADGEVCPFGHEQTPEGFIRHTIELLYLLKPALTPSASVWWNLMDTYNTRTQIRTNAAETLRAMNGQDNRSWGDYECRRYSAGHSFLEDGEQCLIPSRVAERASRIGYLVKSVITWKKDGSMPETVNTRVTRELEYVIHLAVERSPYFDKSAYLQLPVSFGGRNRKYEAEKLTDVWAFPTANGTDGHGAQFPIALPARCIALSTRKNDLVLDPFLGSGSTAVAAKLLDRRCIGFDISSKYLKTAATRFGATKRGSAFLEEEGSLPFVNKDQAEETETEIDQMELWID